MDLGFQVVHILLHLSMSVAYTLSLVLLRAREIAQVQED